MLLNCFTQENQFLCNIEIVDWNIQSYCRIILQKKWCCDYKSEKQNCQIEEYNQETKDKEKGSLQADLHSPSTYQSL